MFLNFSPNALKLPSFKPFNTNLFHFKCCCCSFFCEKQKKSYRGRKKNSQRGWRQLSVYFSKFNLISKKKIVRQSTRFTSISNRKSHYVHIIWQAKEKEKNRKNLNNLNIQDCNVPLDARRSLRYFFWKAMLLN